MVIFPCFEFEDKFKLSAGWLIEKLGYKGKRFGNCGISDKHALVLVNYGGASGREIYELALDIKSKVKEKFGVELQEEVNIV